MLNHKVISLLAPADASVSRRQLFSGFEMPPQLPKSPSGLRFSAPTGRVLSRSLMDSFSRQGSGEASEEVPSPIRSFNRFSGALSFSCQDSERAANSGQVSERAAKMPRVEHAPAEAPRVSCALFEEWGFNPTPIRSEPGFFTTPNQARLGIRPDLTLQPILANFSSIGFCFVGDRPVVVKSPYVSLERANKYPDGPKRVRFLNDLTNEMVFQCQWLNTVNPIQLRQFKIQVPLNGLGDMLAHSRVVVDRYDPANLLEAQPADVQDSVLTNCILDILDLWAHFRRIYWVDILPGNVLLDGTLVDVIGKIESRDPEEFAMRIQLLSRKDWISEASLRLIIEHLKGLAAQCALSLPSLSGTFSSMSRGFESGFAEMMASKAAYKKP